MLQLKLCLDRVSKLCAGCLNIPMYANIAICSIHIIKPLSIGYTGNSRLASLFCNVILCLRHFFFVTITQLMPLCLLSCHCYNLRALNLCILLCATDIGTAHNATLLHFAPLLAIRFIS